MTGLHAFASALLDPDAPAPEGLHSWNGSDPTQRFRVYRNNVAVSLVDALADNFPVVQALVGEEFFRAMALRFSLAQPPANPVLALYGEQLPGFLATFPPALELPYLAEVARLEWLYQSAWHGADAPTVSAAELAPVLAQPECLPGLRLQLHPTAAPFVSAQAAVSLWAAHQRESASEVAAALATIHINQPESAFVVRVGQEVVVVPLPSADIRFLAQLAAGVPLGEASRSAQAADASFDLAPTLGNALHAGLFSAFQIS